MNTIVTLGQPEVATPFPQTPNGGSGPIVSQSGTGQGSSQVFSSVFAQAQNPGENNPPVNTPGMGKTLSDGNLRKDIQEPGSDQTSEIIGESSVLLVQETATHSLLQSDSFLVVEGEQSSENGSNPVPSSVLGTLGEGNPGQLSSGHSATGGGFPKTLTDLTKPSLAMELPTSTKLNGLDTEKVIDLGALSSRQVTNLNQQGLADSSSTIPVLEEKLPQTGAASWGGAVFKRLEEPISGFIPSQPGAGLEIQSFEGATRQLQTILNTYRPGVNSSFLGRGNGVDNNGLGIPFTKLNPGLSETSLSAELSSSSIAANELNAQEFGLDQGESQSQEFSQPQQRTIPLPQSGSLSLFAEAIGDVRDKVGLFNTSSGVAGEGPSHLFPGHPQRLQMDVTLADDSRVQIEVAVQQRQVSAHVVTDQMQLRNLALQNEGQLVWQLADAGLELKNFGAYLSDHPTFNQREAREGSPEGYTDRHDPDGLFDNSSREVERGMMYERGLHFVA